MTGATEIVEFCTRPPGGRCFGHRGLSGIAENLGWACHTAMPSARGHHNYLTRCQQYAREAVDTCRYEGGPPAKARARRKLTRACYAAFRGIGRPGRPFLGTQAQFDGTKPAHRLLWWDEGRR